MDYTILDGLWSGEPFRLAGDDLTMREVTFLPKPLQSPRIPVWIDGGWNTRPTIRRAAKWDGFFPQKWRELISMEEWRGIIGYLEGYRATDEPINLIQGGETTGDDLAQAAEVVAPYTELGLTWWIEHVDPWRFGLDWGVVMTSESHEKMYERILQGPPTE